MENELMANETIGDKTSTPVITEAPQSVKIS